MVDSSSVLGCGSVSARHDLVKVEVRPIIAIEGSGRVHDIANFCSRWHEEVDTSFGDVVLVRLILLQCIVPCYKITFNELFTFVHDVAVWRDVSDETKSEQHRCNTDIDLLLYGYTNRLYNPAEALEHST